MADPRLVKNEGFVLVSDAVPAEPGVPAVPFALFACPLPKGWLYNQYQVSGVAAPNSPATYQNWQQAKRAPRDFQKLPSGEFYLTLAQAAAYLNLGIGSVSVPASWQPVYENTGSGDVLVGYLVPAYSEQELPQRYYGPIAHMTFITFVGAGTYAPNGYPVDIDQPATGYFDVPTLDGVVRVTNQYRKNDKGILYPVGGDPLPAYCTRQGGAHVVMFAGFPGRAEVPARPAVYARDLRIGWDSGANSIDAFDGDCRTVFGVKQVAAIACGFAPESRANDGDWRTLTHAFYFDRDGSGFAQWRVVESGKGITPPRPANSEDQFTIERIEGQVYYYVNDVLMHVSAEFSAGRIVVGSALYQGGDGIY
ncbi:MAG: hypothetical protein AB7V08_13810 [Elusimicrobiales bacterium]